MKLAIYAITDGGAVLGRRLLRSLPGAELWLPERLRAADGARYTSQGATTLLPELFTRCDGLICIMATGIVVRALAPHLRGKAVDAPVVVMDEAGRFAISLIAGHLGGANDLARRVAACTGGEAVITTATDVQGLLAWDEAARRAGLAVEPLERIKRLNSLLLQQAPVVLIDPEERIAPWFAAAPGVTVVQTVQAAHELRAAGRVHVTHRLVPNAAQDEALLLLRPRDLIVGLGCNRGTSAQEIAGAVESTLTQAGLAFAAVAGLATIVAKADEEGLLTFARQHRLPLAAHDGSALNAVTVPSPPSSHALAAVGVNGVCEPAAILSAGGGRLLVPKQKIGNVTVAVAQKG